MSPDASRDPSPRPTDRVRGELPGRLRLVEVRTDHRPDSTVRVVVQLEGPDGRRRAEIQGVGTGVVELRLAAAATLEAVAGAVPAADPLRMVGVKTVRAFDADLVLAVLRGPEDAGRRLVGAVPTGDDPSRAAAAAVLDAVNRVLGEAG